MKSSFLLTPLAFFFSLTLSAQPTFVSDLETLADLVKKARPGDKFVIADGTHSFNGVMKIEGKGTLNDSIFIMARNTGKATIKGRLQLSGDFLVLSGFKFEDPYNDEDSTKGYYVTVNCLSLSNSRISDNLFIEIGRNRTRAGDIGIQISKTSSHNKIERNYWDRPKSICIYVIPPAKHTVIDNNVFANVKGKGRLWNVIKLNNNIQRSTSSLYTVVSNNIFFGFHDNYAEVISLKSSNNNVFNNLFYGCQGDLNFRHGSSNSAIGNVFYNSFGIRIAGENHTILGNYFFKSIKAPIRIMKGGGSLANPPVYESVTNLSILNNTMYVEQLHAIIIGNGGKTVTVAPSNLLFMGNQFYLKQGSNAIYWRLPNPKEGELLHNAKIISSEIFEYDPLKFDHKIIQDLLKNKNLSIPDSLEANFNWQEQ